MLENLRIQLENFKEVTLQLIKKVENNDIEALDELLNKRQDIMEIMDKLDYSQEEFKTLSKALDILTLQKKLLDLMNSKKNELRNEMDKISEVKNANKSYRSKASLDSIYFNKKI